MELMKDRLAELRKAKGLKQTDIAQFLKCSNSTVSGYENGLPLPLDALIKLADYFDVSTDYLLCRTNEKKPDTGRIASLFNELYNITNFGTLSSADIEEFINIAVRYYRAGAPAGSDIPLKCLHDYISHLGNAMEQAVKGDLASLLIEVNAAVVAALDTNNMIGEYCKSTEK